jgi:predicted DNA-binding transcriptional regulator AlpA
MAIRDSTKDTSGRQNRPAWLGAADVCGRFDISRATLERRIRDGSLPAPARIGSLRRWSAAELEKFEQRLLADRGQQ